MNLYKSLILAARMNPSSKRELNALHGTLDYFKISQGRFQVADALLKFRVVKDRDMAFDVNDPLMLILLDIDAHFTRNLRGICCEKS